MLALVAALLLAQSQQPYLDGLITPAGNLQNGGTIGGNLIVTGTAQINSNFTTIGPLADFQSQVNLGHNLLNYIQINGATTGNKPHIDLKGGDATVGLVINTQSTNSVLMAAGGTTTATFNSNGDLTIGQGRASGNTIALTGGASASNAVTIDASGGADTNIGINYNGKGSGSHVFENAGTAAATLTSNGDLTIGQGRASGNTIALTGGATTSSAVTIDASGGADTNIGIFYNAKGNLGHKFETAGVVGTTLNNVGDIVIGQGRTNGDSVFILGGSSGSKTITIQGLGATDTDVTIAFTPKGNGLVGYSGAANSFATVSFVSGTAANNIYSIETGTCVASGSACSAQTLHFTGTPICTCSTTSSTISFCSATSISQSAVTPKTSGASDTAEWTCIGPR